MKYKKLPKPRNIKQGISLVCLLCFVCLIGVYVVAGSKLLLATAIFMLVVTILTISIVMYCRKTTAWICSTMREFIIENELCDFFYNGNKRVFSYFPEVYYKIDEGRNTMGIKFRLPGNKFEFRGLDQKLADKFKRASINTLEERGYIEYLFEYCPEKQLEITSKKDLMDMHMPDNEIALAPSFVWDFKRQPGFGIVGVSGSGKSTFSAILMEKLTAKGCRIIYTDIKRDVDMERYVKSNNMITYACEPEEILKVINQAVHEMEQRSKEVELMGIDDSFDFAFSPIFVICDEIVLMKLKMEDKIYNKVMKQLQSIIVAGRNRGVYVGMISQTSLGEFFGKTAFRTNIGLKVMMGQMPPTEVGMLFGEDNMGVKNLDHSDFGSGLIMSGTQGKPRQFIAPSIKKGVLNI